jgi:hypothetical protein
MVPLAKTCNMDFEDVCWEIQRYVSRKKFAHWNRINTIIASSGW